MAVFKSSPVSTGLERAGQQRGRGRTQNTERPGSGQVGRIRITGYGRNTVTVRGIVMRSVMAVLLFWNLSSNGCA
jgi:hypothetical protein